MQIKGRIGPAVTHRITFRQPRISNLRVAGSAAIASILALVLLSVSCQSIKDRFDPAVVEAKKKGCPSGQELARLRNPNEQGDHRPKCLLIEDVCTDEPMHKVGDKYTGKVCDDGYAPIQ